MAREMYKFPGSRQGDNSPASVSYLPMTMSQWRTFVQTAISRRFGTASRSQCRQRWGITPHSILHSVDIKMLRRFLQLLVWQGRFCFAGIPAHSSVVGYKFLIYFQRHYDFYRKAKGMIFDPFRRPLAAAVS